MSKQNLDKSVEVCKSDRKMIGQSDQKRGVLRNANFARFDQEPKKVENQANFATTVDIDTNQ